MDTNKTMIIAKGKPITSDVESYVFDNRTNKYTITFKGGKSFEYNAQNVSILHNPTSLEPHDYQILYRGNLVDNISAIYVFREVRTEYWHICCSNGYELDCCKEELKIEKSVLEFADAKQIFNYLSEVADNVGPNNEDDSSFLAKQYEKIDFISSETAASVYLNPSKFQADTDLNLSMLIFPFGCNESQYQAVYNALSNRISVIEGPPGTGKTQTILNIIANLIFQGKMIQVVSNNNSAIDNVIEKMADPRYGVDFIVAQLGKDERKTAFIDNQTGTYPDFSSWISDKYNTPKVVSDLQKKLLLLREIFKDKNHLAELKQKLYEVQLEKKYYVEMATNKPLDFFRKPLSLDKLMEFWQEYQDVQNGNIKEGVIYRILRYLTFGISPEQLKNRNSAEVLNIVQGLCYDAAIQEINSEIIAIENKLSEINANELMKECTELSLGCFRGMLAKRYGNNKERKVYTKDSLWQNPNSFLKDYPVVLSTTYTARSSLGKHAQFDYIIMDEASQVDVVAGTLATSCAKNAVIVGDTKQLPNVVTSKQKEELDSIFQKYNIPQAYNYSENSFLKSLCVLLENKIPKVVLREHYRCHPQIIGFCNERFYLGDLIVMTPQDNMPALHLVMTDAGNQEFNHTNMNQFEAIYSKILPELPEAKSQIGIIAPYKNQVSLLERRLGESEIDIATVHRFQGREKEVIILSTVDDIVTEFSDDPNLLNVAISRAKKKLIVVTSNCEQPVGSIIGDLIGYIRYENCDIQHSEIRPVFKFFYSQFEESRRKYLKKHRRISELECANELYKMIVEVLEHMEKVALGVICHQQMRDLFGDLSKMSEEEQRFVNIGFPQLDFLIFNKVTKQPLLAIEVENFQAGKKDSQNVEEDKLKKHILEVYGIPLLCLSGNTSTVKEQLKEALENIIRPKSNYTLVITEKPSVARTYAKVLGAQNKKYKYLEGNSYLISWCYGHLVELSDPGSYNDKYRHWDIKDLPIIPETWKFQIKRQKHLKEQFEILKQLMNRDDVTEILCATDAGREGELIFRLVYQQAKCEKPFRRIWLSSMEQSAIKNAFENPKPASNYDDLYEAARSRQLADWMVGMNATRLFTCLHKKDGGKPLSIGRVVSPTLAMVVDRENEIETFDSKPYFTVNLNVGGVTFESSCFETEDEAIQFKQRCMQTTIDNFINTKD